MEIMVEELDGGLWVAATRDGRLEGLEVDPDAEEVRWGSVYWAKVLRIDKAMDAAFVQLTKDREGFLQNKDVRLVGKDGVVTKGGAISIAKLISPGQMIAVQAKSGYLRREEDFDFAREDKTPKVSMDITLQGRFLVYAPMMEDNQISSRIRSKKLRENMMSMLKNFEPAKGIILRASSEDTQMDILLREARILENSWLRLSPHLEGSTPKLILDGPDAFVRTMGDQASQNIDTIEVVTMDRFKQIEEWCEIFGPDLMPRIKTAHIQHPEEDLALFEHHGLLGDIEDLFQDYGLLRSGGSLIIQQTAALTAIDVNRSGDDRSVMDINTEAALEIARQIRLRNIGGIIMIDFLKFTKKADQSAFLKSVEEAFDGDPCTIQIHGMTALGLLEITRKRRTPPLSERMDSIDAVSMG